MRIALLAALTFALAAPAFVTQAADAEKPAADSKDTKKKAEEDPNRVVCKREHVVGSNRPQRVCMTVAERNRLKDSADRRLDQSRVGVDPAAGKDTTQ